MRNQSAPSYIPGLTTSRLREATGVLGAGLLFALAPSMVILAPALQTHDLAASLRNFLTVSEGFRVTSISTLTFIGSSVLILGLTYALMDRRRLDVDTHVQNERRFSTIARVACLVAIPFAALALPSTFTRLDYVGDAAAIICVLALTVTFAFGAGTSWVTDARQQKASVEATQHSAKRRLERATRVPVPPLGHARLQLVLRVCVTTLTPSAVLGNALSLAGYNSSVAAALGIAVATLSIISWVSVYFAQYGRISASGRLESSCASVGLRSQVRVGCGSRSPHSSVSPAHRGNPFSARSLARWVCGSRWKPPAPRAIRSPARERSSRSSSTRIGALSSGSSGGGLCSRITFSSTRRHHRRTFSVHGLAGGDARPSTSPVAREPYGRPIP